jgi:ribonuclease R
LNGIGFKLDLDKDMRVSSKNINKMLEDVRGHAEESMIQMATVRAMAKAVYTTKNIGHFGLGFEYYTHFTSPIRRYPDLVVHRLLFEYLNKKEVPRNMLGAYEEISVHSSQREKEASDAERASIKYKQTEYMSERVGQVFDGVISGISPNGLFIEEKVSRCEGMVRLRDIGTDFYEYNDKELAIIGRRTRKEFRIGDRVRFKVTSADLARRLIDYVLV